MSSNTNSKNPYTFTDNPTISGISKCDTDILNEDIMFLKYRFDNETPDSLFDLVAKDHELSYEDSEGYEKLGNYVYKEESSGVHYGYPDFYNRCIEEYNAATAQQKTEYSSSNVTLVGGLNDNNGVLQRFSVSSYAKSLETFAPGAADTWEMVWKFKTFSKYPTVLNQAWQWLVSPNANYKGFGFGLTSENKLFLYLSSNGTSWNIANNRQGSKVYSYNTEYYWKLEYTGEKYIFSYSEDGTNWTVEIEISSTATIFDGGIFNIGVAYNQTSPWLGSINLNESYTKINDSNTWEGTENLEYTVYKNKNGHLFYDISEKSVIDKIYNKTGMAWLYGIDTANKRILLPRNDYFYKNDTPGKQIEAGLPDIQLLLRTDGTNAESDGANTALGNDGVTGSNTSGTDEYLIDQEYVPAALRPAYLNKDFAYGNSDTVMPASVGVIIYMVVGTPSLMTAIEDINVAKNNALKNISGTAETAVENAEIATKQAQIATNKANAAASSATTATKQAEIATNNANKVTTALAEANNLKSSLEMLSFIDCGTFGETQTVTYDAGSFGDTDDGEYIDGGAFGDLSIVPDDINNLSNLPLLQKQVSENEDNIAANQKDIEELKSKTDIFTFIDCGAFGETQTATYDAGSFGDDCDNIINSGTFGELSIVEDDFKNVCTIPTMQKKIEDLTALIKTLSDKLTSIESGIDSGYFGT